MRHRHLLCADAPALAARAPAPIRPEEEPQAPGGQGLPGEVCSVPKRPGSHISPGLFPAGPGACSEKKAHATTPAGGRRWPGHRSFKQDRPQSQALREQNTTAVEKPESLRRPPSQSSSQLTGDGGAPANHPRTTHSSCSRHGSPRTNQLAGTLTLTKFKALVYTDQICTYSEK